MQTLLELITTGYTAGVDWFMQIPSVYLYLFLALYMAVEGVTVILPREALLLVYGLLIIKGKLSFWATLFFAELGTTFGALTLYVLALHFEQVIEEKILGRFFTKKDVAKAEKVFRQKGAIAVFVSQILPGLRTLISIPAGTFNMPIVRFAVLTYMGALLWDSVLLYAIKLAGGNIVIVKQWLSLYSEVVLLVVAVLLLGLGVFIYRKRFLGVKPKSGR